MPVEKHRIMEKLEVNTKTDTSCSYDGLNSDADLDIANSVAMEHSSSHTERAGYESNLILF